MSTVIFLIVIAVIAYLCHKNGLTKSGSNKVLGGVSAGIAQRLNLNIALVRVLTVIAGLISGGLVVAVYIVLWITLPERN